MMSLRWVPWKILVKYAARRHGFLDPINLLSQLQRFIQPSEFNEPVELLRAGALMHARGLINSRVIQHNLDWVWPFWVERQFDPRDISFIPRAFAITHINLSHRNWTAVGLPDYSDLPIVDPRGLVTPFIDGWSVDVWLVTSTSNALLPSKEKHADQKLSLHNELQIITKVQNSQGFLKSQVSVQLINSKPTCIINVDASYDEPAYIVIALRPYNPEGVSFVDSAKLNEQRNQWLIDNAKIVEFSRTVDSHHFSDFQHGDVLLHLGKADQLEGECRAGMLTAAAMFKLDAHTGIGQVSVHIPLIQQNSKTDIQSKPWSQHLKTAAVLRIPDQTFQSLYDVALRTLLLHSSKDIYPGPYTYKRFWFRDAVFVLQALLCTGLIKRAEQALDQFSSRQNWSGYFHSQEGEWDSNGQVLWILQRYCQLTGQAPKTQWLTMIKRGADWIINKRLHRIGDAHDGLLPAGFSAEHLGPNNYYYWDNFWGIAGLLAAETLFNLAGDTKLSRKYQRAAKEFQHCVDININKAGKNLATRAIPAAPNRRMDAGAIGSLAMAYPAQLCSEKDERILHTVEFLLDKCCVDNGFFQDMTHSGINAYLTLHIAQVLMRAGDTRYQQLIQRVAELVSPTGQWPEAIHPQTGGGCMGDGQHVWAAAEWIMIMRNTFVREEHDRLVLGAGISEQWLISQQTLKFGPAPTTYGDVTMTIEPVSLPSENVQLRHKISWHSEWHSSAPTIEVRLPGQKVLHPKTEENHVYFEMPR